VLDLSKLELSHRSRSELKPFGEKIFKLDYMFYFDDVKFSKIEEIIGNVTVDFLQLNDYLVNFRKTEVFKSKELIELFHEENSILANDNLFEHDLEYLIDLQDYYILTCPQ
jgi:hypothetical protein